jgi:hypothetical protein
LHLLQLLFRLSDETVSCVDTILVVLVALTKVLGSVWIYGMMGVQ